MTDRAPPRKVIFSCAALAVAAMLGGCSDPDLSKTFADIKAIKVDDSGSTPPEGHRLGKDEVDLAIATAKDLTVNSGGLFAGDTSGGPPRFEIAVIDDPLQMPPPDSSTPLDERMPLSRHDESRRDEPRRDEPRPGTVLDLPRPQTQEPVAPTPPPVRQVAVPPAPSTADVRYIQVGSFATAGAARSAWSGLIGRYPGIDRYSPAYQPVTTAAGKTLVRLKVGPVADAQQAQRLCWQLDIRDSWCVRAS